jgi:uncharacterized protein with PIN domain
MVIDSSAVIAILSNEPEAESLAEAITNDPIRLMSAASLLETAIVIEARYGEPEEMSLINYCKKRKSKLNQSLLNRLKSLAGPIEVMVKGDIRLV